MVRSTVEAAGPRHRLPLYAYFCDFYETLVDVKPSLLRAGARDDAMWRGAESPARRAHERLLEQLRAQQSAVEHDGAPDECALYRDAQYAMAALADEQLLLEVRWSGRAEWLGLMLEVALFDTHVAGVGFYRVIDRLLATQAPTLMHAELGLVLLAVLELGFRGALRGDREAQTLARRRLELAAFVRGVRGYRATGRAFEQAYEHTVRLPSPETASSRLAPLSPWYYAARIALAAYLVVSGVIWFSALRPFNQLIANDAVVQQAGLAGVGTGAFDAVHAAGKSGVRGATGVTGATGGAAPAGGPDNATAAATVHVQRGAIGKQKKGGAL
jgi:type VI secretion system protein ImpK